MQFLANENFPLPSIKVLRSSGYLVKSVVEEMPAATDMEIVETARIEDLIILTFDKDYGEIIFRYGLIEPPPVVFFRYKGSSNEFAGQFIVDLLNDSKTELTNNFTVVEQGNIRQRQYRPRN
jgi:predicted nuclease of predicted toxin-antitoxin system